MTTQNATTTTTMFPTQESFFPFEFAIPPTTQQQQQPNVDDPFLLDMWLLDELQRAGVLTSDTTSVQTPSSSSSNMSPPPTTPPSDTQLFPASPPLTPIKLEPSPPSPPSTTTAQTRRLWPVPIMPKTTTITPTITHGSNSPMSPCIKRKSSSSFDSSEESDEVVRKRQRNTDAARRSRMKKMLKMEALESRVNELENDNARLTTRVAVLESEKNGLETKDSDLQERIKALEEQLAEAHKALTGKCAH
ncbi:hypothetical protein K492DRAFT_172251 [Lichtheimia hyalospora FSU 10163]|nr:hypothetical protein K492DRAFT_172251 [Lichtheimia hyalospora FSU 10163]